MRLFLRRAVATCAVAAATSVLLASCGPESEQSTQPGSSAGRSHAPPVDNSVLAELATYNLNVTPVDQVTANPRFTAAQASAAAQATNTHYGRPFEMSLVRFTNTVFGTKVRPGSSAAPAPTPAVSDRPAWLVLFNNVRMTAAGPAPPPGTPAGPPETETVIMAEFFDADTGAFVLGTTLNNRTAPH